MSNRWLTTPFMCFQSFILDQCHPSTSMNLTCLSVIYYGLLSLTIKINTWHKFLFIPISITCGATTFLMDYGDGFLDHWWLYHAIIYSGLECLFMEMTHKHIQSG